jgi:hypothetical protein
MMEITAAIVLKNGKIIGFPNYTTHKILENYLIIMEGFKNESDQLNTVERIYKLDEIDIINVVKTEYDYNNI